MNDERPNLVELRSAVDGLRAALSERKRVDLCDFGELKFFLHTDDWLYQTLPSAQRGYRLHPDDVHRVRHRTFRKRSVDDLYAGQDVLLRVMGHFWLHGLDFCYFDIGCPFGMTAIGAAHAIEACGRANPTVCFEPGVGADLVEQNIALNGFEGRVVFERAAVTDHGLPVIVSSRIGRSTSNRTVNRDPGAEDSSFVVPGVTVDGYIRSKGIDSNVILKAHTEGAEYEILRGMRETMRSRLVAAIWEFQPAFLSTRVDPSAFLALAADDGYLVDIGQEHTVATRAALVPAPGLDQFVEEVLGRAGQWTDILVLPRKLPGVEALLDRLGIACPTKPEVSDGGDTRIWFGPGWFRTDADGRWVAPVSEMIVINGRRGKLVIDAWIPPEIFRDSLQGSLVVRFPAQLVERRVEYAADRHGLFRLALELPEGDEVDIRMETDRSFSPARLGLGPDARELAFFVKSVAVLPAGEPRSGR